MSTLAALITKMEGCGRHAAREPAGRLAEVNCADSPTTRNRD
ncbi:hypothetical protein [Spirillospora sp. CA-128828]